MHTGYAEIIAARPGRYLVAVGFVRGCRMATACAIGTIEGKRLNVVRRTPGSPVRLAGSRSGYFTPFRCGASCGSSQVVWDVGRFRYTLALKGGSKDNVVNAANSSIQQGRL